MSKNINGWRSVRSVPAQPWPSDLEDRQRRNLLGLSPKSSPVAGFNVRRWGYIKRALRY